MATDKEVTLSILMPCLNEARTLGICIAKAKSYLARQSFTGEIVIADNGSIDGSQEIAGSLGARVVQVSERGYGCALKAGIKAARGKYVIMGDSDESYDFESLDGFVEQLEAGYDLVCGNRFIGGIEDGAMPLLHRYFGNPLLTMIGRLLFKSPVNDFYCGMRGFRRDAILRLGLTAPGMEFALEMVVKSTIGHLRITEVPTTLRPDGRARPPHLRSWRDGWRSLRFYLAQPRRPVPLSRSCTCGAERDRLACSVLYQHQFRLRRLRAAHSDCHLCINRHRHPVCFLLDLRQVGRDPEAAVAS
jgi:glycosyltransferase involved in cell wall biosynthesis